jgi:hypothetical protein
MADWHAILHTDLVDSAKLLDALEAHIVPGTSAVMIVSVAGHSALAIRSVLKVWAAELACAVESCSN